MAPTLNHTRIAASADAMPERWLLVLHGIYGSGRNWATIARRLVEERPDWGVILPDLRLHGASPGFHPPHTLAAAAGDVAALIESQGLNVSALLGHSYGGKVALALARDHGEGIVQTWVIDSTLEVREPSGSAWRLIEAVRSLPRRFSSREELVEGLSGHGYPAPLANWLGMNLQRDGDGLSWKLDWDGVEEMLRDYFVRDLWSVVEDPPEGMAMHVVRAGDSDSIGDGDAARIRRAGERTGATHLHVVEGGHWINVDNPAAVVDLLSRQLPGRGATRR
jgi:esterase